jgi:hypothetical protein
MNLELNQQQASEVDSLIGSALRDMSHEIAATDNSQFRAQLVARRNVLRAVADALRPHLGDRQSAQAEASLGAESDRVWTVVVVFTEEEDRTRADARMRAVRREWHGWGRARRNPLDPDVPMIGEELAAARALSDLSHQLVDAAAHAIESFEGHPVRLHS